MNKPKIIKAIYDDPGAFDRYTIVLTEKYIKHDGNTYHTMIGLSENPSHLLGVSQFSEGQIGKHLGKKLNWNNLSKSIQNHIISKL